MAKPTKHRSAPQEEEVVEVVSWLQTDPQRRRNRSGTGGEKAGAPRRWAARYSTFFMKLTPMHAGAVLLLQPGGGDSPRLVLKDGRGVTIDARLLRDGESVSSGDTVVFPCHQAIVGRAQRE